VLRGRDSRADPRGRAAHRGVRDSPRARAAPRDRRVPAPSPGARPHV